MTIEKKKESKNKEEKESKNKEEKESKNKEEKEESNNKEESKKKDILKEYLIYHIQQRYTKYSTILYNYQSHIERLHEDFVITNTDRNNYLKIVNEILKTMNTKYNLVMLDLCNTNNNNNNNNNNKIIFTQALETTILNNPNNKQDVLHLYNIYNNKDYLSDIKDKIISQLASKISFKSIKDCLNLFIQDDYTTLFSKQNLAILDLYDLIFVPVSYKLINSLTQHIKTSKSNLDNPVIFFPINISVPLSNLLNNSQTIILSGYLMPDPLNIITRTSQISRPNIYQQKKILTSLMLDKENKEKEKENKEKENQENIINQKFMKAYIRSTPLVDILTLTSQEYSTKMSQDYVRYLSLSKLNFLNLMKQFISDTPLQASKSSLINNNNTKFSIKNMFYILNLLLLDSDKHINVAGLLFSITRDKKIGTDYYISDIIYKNLNYTSQLKLKKSIVNLKLELEKIKSVTLNDVDLQKQIATSTNMPLYVKKAALEKVEEMKGANNEYYKQLLYVKTLINFPWPSPEDDQAFINVNKSNSLSIKFLDNVVTKLDKQVYGHKECKDSIKELIAKWISNPDSSGSAIGLVGPPGVGKTLIAKALGDSLDIPFVQITLGGQNDGEILHGHGYTYSGSQPGMVVKKMVEAGNARCIMYFDELDKACRKQDNNEIYSILIHMTDPNTNSMFQDRFFQEINFPLNKVLFIFSYNDSSLIDPILLDRIKEIDVKPFKLQDKIIVSKGFLIQEACTMVGFDPNILSINDTNIEFIVEQYTYEPGVRDLKRKLEKLLLKLNIDKIYGVNVFKNNKKYSSKKKIVITREMIIDYLGKHTVEVNKIHIESLVGVVNGLYATDGGKGGVLPIQIFNNYTSSDDSKFMLRLTGSQRRVMRESVMSAFTTAMHQIKEKVRLNFLTKHPHGFHIHTPSGATPKDGPSAGAAFTTAFISRILNKKIRNDVAMTGEIELTGKITKIGGLAYKLNGAKRAGVKLALVPKENEEDIETIKKDYKDLIDDNFEVVLVDNIKDVLEHTLEEFDINEIEETILE
jgi:endopeptidase La